ncbi:hypothetical protein F5X96DRAFT_664469 [Biscogniauxia mediterranea]|nr:hypothetical protein F5X96DRAFT_664469 [Biscogniauxia mediterranea]
MSVSISLFYFLSLFVCMCICEVAYPLTLQHNIGGVCGTNNDRCHRHHCHTTTTADETRTLTREETSLCWSEIHT